MKKQTKAVAAKRPRTYKKSDLPRTARAYLGKTYSIHLVKENEAVARLIELHDKFVQPQAEPAFVRDPEPKKLTLREQFLAWIGVKP